MLATLEKTVRLFAAESLQSGGGGAGGGGGALKPTLFCGEAPRRGPTILFLTGTVTFL